MGRFVRLDLVLVLVLVLALGGCGPARDAQDPGASLGVPEPMPQSEALAASNVQPASADAAEPHARRGGGRGCRRPLVRLERSPGHGGDFPATTQVLAASPEFVLVGASPSAPGEVSLRAHTARDGSGEVLIARCADRRTCRDLSRRVRHLVPMLTPQPGCREQLRGLLRKGEPLEHLASRDQLEAFVAEHMPRDRFARCWRVAVCARESHELGPGYERLEARCVNDDEADAVARFCARKPSCEAVAECFFQAHPSARASYVRESE